MATTDVDKPGVRVAVLEKGAADNILTPLLKQATLIRVATVNEAVELVKSGQADAMAALKTFLYPASDRIPGSRVLNGQIYVEQIGAGVPKGGDPAAAAYVRKFVDEAKASGLVKEIVARAAPRGFDAAP